jgi:hypothetical protein
MTAVSLGGLSLFLLAVLLAQTPMGTGAAVESVLTIQPSIADTFVNSMYLRHIYPEQPHGYLWAIFAGNMYEEYDSFKGYGSSRIYIKFNATSIPKDAMVLSANMCLYMYDPPKTSQEFTIYRVLSDWDQHKLTWVIQPPSAGNPTSSTTIDPYPREGWVCWDITNDLKLWHSGAAVNYGSMIKIKHEMNASDQLASFYPKEASQSQSLKPKLQVKINWHQSIGPPSPTSSPTQTPTTTPSPTSPSPTTTSPPANTATQTFRPETQAVSSFLLPAGILVLVIVGGGGILAFERSRRRKTIPKKRKKPR